MFHRNRRRYSGQRENGLMVLGVALVMSFTLGHASFAAGSKNADKSDFGTFDRPNKSLPHFTKGNLAPVWTIKDPKALLSLPEFSLQSQRKDKFTHADVRGKIIVANFFFASCGGVCPVLTRNIKTVHDKYRKRNDMVFISFSVTPKIDTKAALKEFAERHKVDQTNWHFVRGDRQQIYAMARDHLYADLAIDLKKDEDQFVHSESTYLIDRSGRVRGIYNGNSLQSLRKMAQAIEVLAAQIKPSGEGVL